MYLSWDEQTIVDFGEKNVESMYARGYVFTRKGKGVMQQTRSVRVDLARFELSSENRRVLGKAGELGIMNYELWMSPSTGSGQFAYNWRIGKMAKDFYDRFGKNTFSANKVKELLTDQGKSNYNTLIISQGRSLGYAICYVSKNILHYAYPFYKENGLAQMTQAIVWAKEQGKKYVYVGSASRATDTYKLQFAGVEWFTLSDLSRASSREVEGVGEWSNDLDKLKQILKNA